ncbi:hypothetical protein L873DRAFT_1757933 [Choiromyces venosus 120613-1]|uniref:Rhodopsin domain-containing protein n=1 Tax=Choiromyces venosus 120613-1 TaxID=1336337 RepID=A0A3N4K451_9PEZI|nr:hypothetical protein L873DRAFT_1757933 [Choiromyces venosus 120613-1]
MALASPTPQQLTVESWSMYSVGVTLIIGRIYSRCIILHGFRNLQTEDYLMIFNAVTYTTLMAAINVSGRTATNLLEPGVLETLTPSDIEARIYGSKIVILLEQSMLILIWGIKGCMILMYNRLTTRLQQQILVRAVGIYIAAGFVAVELAWFTSCRPFSGYWALPVPMEQCATYQHYSIVQASFNISSDLMMLCIAIPLFLRAKVPTKKKLILVGIFGCGIFVILAAILNKYYNFSNPFTTIYMLWYIREASTAVYVSNLPMLWPLFRRVFNIGTFQERSTPKYDTQPLSNLSKKKSTQTSLAGSEDRITREPALEIDQRISFTVEEYRREEKGADVDVELASKESLESIRSHGGYVRTVPSHVYKAEVSSGAP